MEHFASILLQNQRISKQNAIFTMSLTSQTWDSKLKKRNLLAHQDTIKLKLDFHQFQLIFPSLFLTSFDSIIMSN